MWPMFCAINPFSLTLNTSKHLRFCTCPNFFAGLIWALYGGIYCQGELPLQQVKQCLYATRALFSSSSQHNPAKTNIETNNKCCTLIGGRIPLLGSPSFIWGRGNYPLINQHPNIKHPLPYHQSHNHGFWECWILGEEIDLQHYKRWDLFWTLGKSAFPPASLEPRGMDTSVLMLRQPYQSMGKCFNHFSQWIGWSMLKWTSTKKKTYPCKNDRTIIGISGLWKKGNFRRTYCLCP